ncbi:nicotinate-nucleotide pyrophosphorylase (carboxylating) [Nitratiruptor sp. YY08-26]|uniref:carboxylating nicotinate-nucleotide diphosphorylase n=1 Tax=unclassified Nitratiruptor TaxID=2624044 RepID=UPI00191521F0|nr:MULTISPECIES: carboxylating nicotinate-nucleotide diphosphorylase [unclassified Nitratiruptor]BCD61602.1 nicotinate-nucleotide pyrophosphorylase (carboxylating) [Nitratiruptor sp. YY08-13]BCD65536.1 nicotinate-nucleotide pyrophosphorylase (carboxylating) [Nitratiruptor sp. YY08-26]
MGIEEFAKVVLAEDIGRGDLFERVGESRQAAAKIVAKSEGVLAGQPYADAIATQLGLKVSWQKNDGDAFREGDIIAYVYGESIALLKAERSLLNTILHASGIAIKAREFVRLSGGKIKVLDTRKTRPGLRVFEKYAARIGGVINHRMGLDDCLMLKDTHLATIEDLGSFVQKARKAIPFTAKIEIECESFARAKEAMEAGADIIMCDNMEIEEIKKVVELRNEHFSHVLIEASGNITPANIKEYIDTGIDAISSGSIVHQAVWPDISMKIEL